MENIVKQTVEKIFTDGQGRKANRLVMEFDEKINGTGWGRQAIGDIILNAIKESSPLEALVIRNFAEIIDEHIEIAKNDCMNENTSYMRGYIKGCNKIKEIIASKISA